uniref:ABC transporter ATP-binding protein n=1 Tax=Desulfobacca acetoxidans TaxID=60893 RepID=A0A7V6A1A2_9BACT
MAAGEPECALRIEGLTKRFGERVAVDHVSLTVAPGESFALVGPDGAGKTTTMRLLVGIMDPDEGSAAVLGLDPVTQGDQVREHIGYMPQRFGLYGDLTVMENLHFYADLYRVERETRATRMPELLRFSGLEPFTGRPAANLSGGMRQKLGLICSLIHHPQVLLLDEPTFGVDPVSRREFWHILYQLLKTGITIFLSTAYMDEAERAQRVGLMHQGRLLVAATPQAIKSGFAGELLEVRAKDLRAARRIIEADPAARQVLAMGDRLMVTVADRAAAQKILSDTLKKAGLDGVSLAPAEPTLEDLFVQVIRQHSG